MSRGHVYVKAGVRRANLLVGRCVGECFGMQLTEGTPDLDAQMQRCCAAPSERSSLAIHNRRLQTHVRESACDTSA